ncbi:hypothetical protein H2200_010867 [Cladophialophora chaetospira]|uniref:Major facilitator superfamily (MFS) profile domain-containing protein n=1 Tax=Cladophialophora chaetospira TaxID=386627 RepID=A0AA38X0Z8_9EURO|nr:hypothetical protein H2200_010867 [Cladophialophora chaetospira]
MAKLTKYNIAICLSACTGGFSYGFGAGSLPTSLGQPGFYTYFNLEPTSLYTANVVSALSALFFFGCAVGSLGQCFLADRIGRRKSLGVGGLIALLGGALVAGSVAVPMLIVVRLLQGAGLGMLLALVPLYLTEVAPPRTRGFLTGLTTLSFGTGYIMCAWISLGCYHASNATLSWRLPLALGCVGPLALLFGVWFIPESPRFLVWKGQRERAWLILKRLHHDPRNASEADAKAEFTQIVRQVEVDKEDEPTFYKMFTKPSWRRRSVLVFFLLFAGQSTGVYGIGNFLPLILTSLGMTGDMPLVINAAQVTVGTIAVLASIILVDRFGRRTLFLIGFASLAVILLSEALLQWKYLGTDSKAGNAACVLFIFLFIIFFQCVDAPALVWAAEIFPTNLRAKGVSLAVFTFFAGAITFSTPAPVAFKNIGWRMFLIYFALMIISEIVVYFYICETKGLPVEEIGALFGDEVVAHLTSDGQGIIEDKQAAEQIEGQTVQAEGSAAQPLDKAWA